jgi:hypothetical protein
VSGWVGGECLVDEGDQVHHGVVLDVLLGKLRLPPPVSGLLLLSASGTLARFARRSRRAGRGGSGQGGAAGTNVVFLPRGGTWLEKRGSVLRSTAWP